MDLVISKKYIEKVLSDYNAKYKGLEDVIYPLLNNKTLGKKESLEICQIGKFVYLIDSDMKIIEKTNPPLPDFLLLNNSSLIGLEHTRIISENADTTLKISNLVDYASKVFEKKYPNQPVFASIEFREDKFKFKQEDKKRLATLIADVVYCILSGNYVELPNFLSEIKTQKHTKVSFSFKERNWQPKPLSLSRLESEIRKKEKKIPFYNSTDKKLTEIWLVLLIGSLTSKSYEIDHNIEYKIDSKFDRVYLMSDYEGEIIRVK